MALTLPSDLLKKLAETKTPEEVERVLNSSVLGVVIGMGGKISRKEQMARRLLQLRNQFNHLEGVEIGRADAARKYEVTPEAILSWEKQTLPDGSPVVKVYDQGNGNKNGRGRQVIVDECHVAARVMLLRESYTKGENPGPLRGFSPRSVVKRRSA